MPSSTVINVDAFSCFMQWMAYNYIVSLVLFLCLCGFIPTDRSQLAQVDENSDMGIREYIGLFKTFTLDNLALAEWYESIWIMILQLIALWRPSIFTIYQSNIVFETSIFPLKNSDSKTEEIWQDNSVKKEIYTGTRLKGFQSNYDSYTYSKFSLVWAANFPLYIELEDMCKSRQFLSRLLVSFADFRLYLIFLKRCRFLAIEN